MLLLGTWKAVPCQLADTGWSSARREGILRHVGYGKTWHYVDKEIKLVRVLKNECGHSKICVKKVMRALNKVKVRGKVGSNQWKYVQSKGR